MTFPFSVQFNKRLEATISPSNKQAVLNCIEKNVLERKAANVVIGDMSVTCKGSTSIWRGSLFKGIDNGTFNLVYKGNSWWLNYQINMRNLFIGTAALSLFMEVFAIATGGPWWIGIAAFIWLCGANWVTNLVRHGSLNTEIGLEVDKLISGKTQLPEQDKMTGELKSWF